MYNTFPRIEAPAAIQNPGQSRSAVEADKAKGVGGAFWLGCCGLIALLAALTWAALSLTLAALSRLCAVLSVKGEVEEQSYYMHVDVHVTISTNSHLKVVTLNIYR